MKKELSGKPYIDELVEVDVATLPEEEPIEITESHTRTGPLKGIYFSTPDNGGEGDD